MALSSQLHGNLQHIHLLIHDRDGGEIIPKTMQLAAGRTAQEYNQRKRRKGAFWEDRYHATAVQTDQHLVQCIVDMGLNMVKAGVVKRPSEWLWRDSKCARTIEVDRQEGVNATLAISDSDQVSVSH